MVDSNKTVAVGCKTEISRRLKKINLNNNKKKVAALAMLLGLFGLILMIIENELYMHNVYSKSSTASYLMKSTISLSTVLLLVSLVYYYKILIEVRKRILSNLIKKKNLINFSRNIC